MLCAALLGSGLKIALNKGNPKLNLGPGAGQNEASLCEFADISLLHESSEEEIKNKLAPFITGGFKIESIKEVPYGISSVEVLASHAAYTVKTEGREAIEIIIRLDDLRSLGMAQILLTWPGLEVGEHQPEILRTALLWQKADGTLAAV